MEKVRVLCVGVNPAFDITLTVDGLDTDRVNRVTSERRAAAGKAANVACVLAEMGIAVGLTGFYGSGTWSDWLSLYEKRAEGVCQLPVLISGATRQNITLLADGSTVKINRSGDAVDEFAIRILSRQIVSWLRPGDIAIFTGSIPPGMSKRQYLDVIAAAKSVGARIAVDSDALTREELLEIRPWLYKPNAHELAKLSGADSQDTTGLIEQARSLTQEGVAVVLLTLGERGLAVVTQTEVVRIAAREIKAINTVGAGDAALAAFIAAFLIGGNVDECAHAAADAGERVVAAEA